MCPMPATATRLSTRPTFVRATTLPPGTLSEAALIERCKSGDPNAWDALIRRYNKPVSNFAYSLSHNLDDAGDIAGLFFLHLYQKLHTFRSESSFTIGRARF